MKEMDENPVFQLIGHRILRNLFWFWWPRERGGFHHHFVPQLFRWRSTSSSICRWLDAENISSILMSTKISALWYSVRRDWNFSTLWNSVPPFIDHVAANYLAGERSDWTIIIESSCPATDNNQETSNRVTKKRRAMIRSNKQKSGNKQSDDKDKKSTDAQCPHPHADSLARSVLPQCFLEWMPWFPHYAVNAVWAAFWCRRR